MSSYEYQCSSCSKHHEIWQKISEKLQKTCPDCSGPLRKLISMSSFQLHGGGWYADGYSSVKSNERKKIGDDSGPAKDKAITKEKPTVPPP